MSHFAVRPAARKNARGMRRAMTEAELKLWNTVRAHRLMGLAFRRQRPVAGYIVDFACPKHRIVVEVDGSGHGATEAIAHDRKRDKVLKALGWTVLRFWNDDVVKDIDGVCDHIIRAIGIGAFE